jgi:hypothetical protein
MSIQPAIVPLRILVKSPIEGGSGMGALNELEGDFHTPSKSITTRGAVNVPRRVFPSKSFIVAVLNPGPAAAELLKPKVNNSGTAEPKYSGCVVN